MNVARASLALVLSLGACSADDVGAEAGETSDGSTSPSTTGSTGPDSVGTTGSTTEGPTTGSGTQGSESGVVADVTYERDVRAVLERHCVGCHSDGNIAPFALTNYDEVMPYREAIVASVDAGTMPPWGMESDCNDFVGDLSMLEADKAMLSSWVDAGAPQGDPSDYVAPEPIEQPGLSRTDLTLSLPEPYTPQLSPDDYRCFLLDWPEDEVTFVTGFQFEPDNTAITHHVIVYVVPPERVEEFDQLDADDPGPGYTCFGGPGGDSALDFVASRWLGAWAPGTAVGDLPAGTGLRIEPGSKVAVQMHYNTLADNGMPDQSRVHYKLDSQVEREAYMLPWADPSWLMGGMPIAAGDAAATHAFTLDPTGVIDLLTDIIPPNSPIEFHSTIHHMHRRGRRGNQSVIRADGTEECLLSVPRYDYNWQMSFRYQEPLILEPGDQLHVECEWDNSDNAQGINWGDGTADEMCLGIFYVTEPK